MVNSRCGPIRKVGMSRPSQTESRYVQTVPDGKSVCPDRPRQKVPMSRHSCVHQTIRAFMIRLSCVHQTFRAFMSRLSSVHQIFGRSPDFRAFMIRLSCVHQTFVRSPDFCVFTRLSCVHDQTFVRSSEPSCVHVQTVVHSPDLFAFTRYCAFIKLGCDDPIFVPSRHRKLIQIKRNWRGRFPV